tara:strand:- start:332 stop:520 length:189 start_codon:yes stop_codon:yes gene_type:complete
MGDESLNPEQQAHLRFLKQQVDQYQNESNRIDYHPNVKQDLQRAMRELKEYRLSLQREGVEI